MAELAYVYILASSFQHLYIGVTTELEIRIHKHKNGTYSSSFTKRYKIDKLVYFERYTLISAAIAREKQLKRWSRIKKIRLIDGICSMASMEDRAGLERRLKIYMIASKASFVCVVAVSAWNFFPVARSVVLNQPSPFEITHVALRNILFCVTAIAWVCLEMMRKKIKAQLKAT